MRGKILFAAGLAVGYVLGTRAGRERYEQLKNAALGFWNDPRVQRRVDQVEDLFSHGAKKVVDQVTNAVRKPAASTPPAPSAAKTTAKSAATPTAKSATKRSSAAGSTS
jgi:hypothetical protein